MVGVEVGVGGKRRREAAAAAATAALVAAASGSGSGSASRLLPSRATGSSTSRSAGGRSPRLRLCRPCPCRPCRRGSRPFRRRGCFLLRRSGARGRRQSGRRGFLLLLLRGCPAHSLLLRPGHPCLLLLPLLASCRCCPCSSSLHLRKKEKNLFSSYPCLSPASDPAFCPFSAFLLMDSWILRASSRSFTRTRSKWSTCCCWEVGGGKAGKREQRRG